MGAPLLRVGVAVRVDDRRRSPGNRRGGVESESTEKRTAGSCRRGELVSGFHLVQDSRALPAEPPTQTNTSISPPTDLSPVVDLTYKSGDIERL